MITPTGSDTSLRGRIGTSGRQPGFLWKGILHVRIHLHNTDLLVSVGCVFERPLSRADY